MDTSSITSAPPTFLSSHVDTKGYVEAAALQQLLNHDGNPETKGLGYQRVLTHYGSTYKDTSTVIIVPSREPKFHWRVVQSWMNLISPMNQKRAFIFVINEEVGRAYSGMIKQLLADPGLSQWRYVMTLESDNVQPPDAHIRLIESIDGGGFDGVSGIYYTKGDINMPMAYGDPAHYMRTGELEFRPRDVRSALQHGNVMEVNGIAMGCSLYRMDLFRSVPEPWFVTVSDVVNGAPQGFTQDLYFCKRAREMGKRFAVDFRVHVGHIDESTGQIY